MHALAVLLFSVRDGHVTNVLIYTSSWLLGYYDVSVFPRRQHCRSTKELLIIIRNEELNEKERFFNITSAHIHFHIFSL